MKKFYLIFISILFILLVACNTNEQSLDTNSRGLNEDDTISSLNTDSSSEGYPHTTPIKIQDAKYKFKVQLYKGDGDNNQNQQQQDTQMKVPQQNQIQNQDGTQQETDQQQRQEAQPPQQNEQQNQGDEQQNTQKQQSDAKDSAQGQNQANKGISKFATSVIRLTNDERRNVGLPALKSHAPLSKVAKAKSKDMENKGYFSHTSPTYGSPFDMMRDFGVSYQSAGENIAQGQRTPEAVVEAWMNSQGHRENILNDKFTHIGVGFEQAGHHWTQMFIQK
ncbi:CAP domain-containing protein [Virgibacillus sp. DJP39]|uniref:CAP domain-containing protein n=1 Tax=Virgibacillus sp. DJP39 TaxID=3409790 RepID=UPI003BB7AFC0